MKYTVEKIISSEDANWNGTHRTWFTTTGKTVYILTKPHNVPTEGEVLEGTIALDKQNNYKFTKDKIDQNAPRPTHTSAPAPQPERKQFKADPDKMKQEFTLEQAKNMSIQRQVAVKGAIDLIVAGQGDYASFHAIYVDIMEVLSEPNWHNFRMQATVDPTTFDNEPPLELYDQLPTEEDVNNVEDALDNLQLEEPF